MCTIPVLSIFRFLQVYNKHNILLTLHLLVPDEVKPATKCAFTIATDEYDHLDDQENK